MQRCSVCPQKEWLSLSLSLYLWISLFFSLFLFRWLGRDPFTLTGEARSQYGVCGAEVIEEQRLKGEGQDEGQCEGQGEGDGDGERERDRVTDGQTGRVCAGERVRVCGGLGSGVH